MRLEYVPLEAFGFDKLKNVLENDSASSSYDKPELGRKLIGCQNDTDQKIQGYVIRELDNKESLWGFVLFESGSKNITDMYTFEQERGNNLFKLIGFFMQNQENWTGEFAYDDNSQKLSKWFQGAATDPLAHEYTVLKA